MRTKWREPNNDLAHEPPLSILPQGRQLLHKIAQNIEISSWLMRCARKRAIYPEKVVAMLNQHGIEFVMIGATITSSWANRPQATTDVDIIVSKRHIQKVVSIFRIAYPNLAISDCPFKVRFSYAKDVHPIIDIIKPSCSLLRTAFENCIEIELRGLVFRIANLEMAMAMKYAGIMPSACDQAALLYDTAAFITMSRVNPEINCARLARLAHLVDSKGKRTIIKLFKAAIAEDMSAFRAQWFTSPRFPNQTRALSSSYSYSLR